MSDLKQHKASILICYHGNYIKMTISRYPFVILKIAEYETSFI